MSRTNDYNREQTEQDEQVLDALLDEALSAESDDAACPDLAQRIHEATAQHFAAPRDAVLDPLLDESLCVRAADVPQDLPDRVYSATADRLPGRSVVARIGFRRWAIAAALAIASTGVFFSVGTRLHQAQQLAEFERELAQTAETQIVGVVGEPAVPEFDHRIDEARQAAERLESTFATNDWQHAWSDLDAELRAELDLGL